MRTVDYLSQIKEFRRLEVTAKRTRPRNRRTSDDEQREDKKTMRGG